MDPAVACDWLPRERITVRLPEPNTDRHKRDDHPRPVYSLWSCAFTYGNCWCKRYVWSFTSLLFFFFFLKFFFGPRSILWCHWSPQFWTWHVTVLMDFKARVVLSPAHLLPYVWCCNCLFHQQGCTLYISVYTAGWPSRHPSCQQKPEKARLRYEPGPLVHHFSLLVGMMI